MNSTVNNFFGIKVPICSARKFTSTMATGGRLCSTIHRRFHICFSEGRWAYGSIFPTRERTHTASLFPQRGAPTFYTRIVNYNNFVRQVAYQSATKLDNMRMA